VRTIAEKSGDEKKNFTLLKEGRVSTRKGGVLRAYQGGVDRIVSRSGRGKENNKGNR